MNKKIYAIITTVLLISIFGFAIYSLLMPVSNILQFNNNDVMIRNIVKPKNEENKNNDKTQKFFECNIYAIQRLINSYYDYYLKGMDSELLKLCDTFGTIDDEERIFFQNNVEQLFDIKCFAIEGMLEDSYLIVSYGYGKIYGINTAVPIIGKFFVRGNKSGSYYICNSEVSNEISAYNESMFKTSQVKDIEEMAAYELNTACEVDLILKRFVDDNKARFYYLGTDNNMTNTDGNMSNTDSNITNTDSNMVDADGNKN